MNMDDLRTLQAPLKERYRSEPDAALITLRAQGRIGEGVTCSVQTGRALVEAGLHPATGGTGTFACSGDMLLEALAACAGVTMAAVATAIGVNLRGGTVRAEGDLDFRGTLGVAPARIWARYRRLCGTACHLAPPDRALLRRLSDVAPAPGDRGIPEWPVDQLTWLLADSVSGQNRVVEEYPTTHSLSGQHISNDLLT